MTIEIARRSLIRGIGMLLAAPAIVQASSIMSVRSLKILPSRMHEVDSPGDIGLNPEWVREQFRRSMLIRQEVENAMALKIPFVEYLKMRNMRLYGAA